MKKLFAILLCSLSFCACNKDSNNGVEEPVIDYAHLLVGQWVYDHPEEGVWETLKFTSSGMFYYSNSNEKLFEFENDNVNGRYFVNGNLVTGTYTLNETIQMNLDMQIIKINDLEFTARFNDSGLTFTYARLLDSEIVEYQKNITPNYRNLLRGVDIITYTSHNTKVATVNPSTGEVTGVASGRTYIDVITSEGTAVVEIIVTGILPYNFDEFIGVEKSVIYETFGANPADEEEDVIVYQNISDEIKYLRIGVDLLSEKVSDIRLYLEDINSDDVLNITQYLGNLYSIYDKGTTETYKAYINNENFDAASVGITWDIPNMEITYIKLDHDLFTDYSPLLGKAQSDVKARMKGYQPFMEDKNQLAYGISDGKVDMLCCYYTLDFVTTYDKAQAVYVTLNSQLNHNDVMTYLSKKYLYLEEESSSTEKVYLTSDGLMAIFYSTEYNQVAYYSNVPNSNSNYLHSFRKLNWGSAILK